MRGRSARLAVLAVAGVTAAVVVLASGVALWWAETPKTEPRPLAVADAPPAGQPAPAPAPSEAGAERPPSKDAPGASEPLEALDDRAAAWATVDLDAVRRALPDNLYWTMSAPTKDPVVLRQREEERARWNVEYGKVLSNTATAEEIDAYYAHRQRLSTDYVAFAGYLLHYYRDRLPKQDVGLLKLAMDMHLARLEEIPRQIVEAQQRREAHDAARRAWLADQKAFGADPAGSP